MKACYLAVDIGASSGRHIAGTVENGKICLHEVYRFENHLMQKNGHLCWQLEYLAEQVIAGMKACKKAGFLPASMGIDTWAVDFVLLDAAGKILGDPVAYRDERTEGIAAELEPTLPFTQLYEKTGIQYQRFNTIYQLLALKKENPEQLAKAKFFLMIPDYLAWRLTGTVANEYTNASTTALVNAEAKTWDVELLEQLGFPKEIFLPLKMPGDSLGRLTPDIQKEVGFDCEVLLPATHDTGSAFLAVPTRDDAAVTLSSGTWSLLGVENETPITTGASRKANFTNEGGYAYRYRYLKNSMGLWMIQSIRRELAAKTGQKPDFPSLIAAARAAADFPALVDVNDGSFLAPESMISAVKEACAKTGQHIPQTTGEVLQCVYNSLAQDYARTVRALQTLTGKTYTSINIVGGGSQDMHLDQLTANATGLTVFAGPTEGTALGNLMVQMLARHEYPNLQSARDALKESFSIMEVTPQ